MITVVNKFTLTDIAKMVNKSLFSVYCAMRVKETVYEKYFSEIPEPTFIEGNKRYYDSEGVEKFKQFFNMDKMQKKIFYHFMKEYIYNRKNIKYE